MPRYPKQDDPKGKKVIPSVTEIISDCTDSSAPLMQWAANMCKEWIIENGEPYGYLQDEDLSFYRVNDRDLDEMRFNFRKVSQKALDIGSEVHGLIERYLKGKIQGRTTSAYVIAGSIQNEQAQNAFIAFSKWEEEHNLKPIALEQTVYGDGWAGTLDFYGYFDGKLFVIDWKSSKAHYPEMRYQVAAYRRSINGRLADKYLRIYGPTGEGALNYTKHKAIGCGVLRLDKETGLPDWKDTSKTYLQDLEVFNAMVNLYFKRHPKIAKQARG